jgi:hypothetical protein
MDVIRDIRRKEKFQIDDEYLNGYARHCGPMATLVYLSLCRHVNSEQQCFPSKKLISEELSIGERSVYNGLKTLEEWNIIKIEPQERKPDGSYRNNIYTLLDKSVWKMKPQASGADGRKIHDPQASDDNHRRHVVPNKDTHNTKDTHSKEVAPPSGAGKDINELMDKFKTVNPSYQKLFGKPPQRAAMERMLAQHGRDKMEWVLNILPKTNRIKYYPIITTPLELEDNFGKLIANLHKDNSKGPMLVTI